MKKVLGAILLSTLLLGAVVIAGKPPIGGTIVPYIKPPIGG